jgi:hypothetical protein
MFKFIVLAKLILWRSQYTSTSINLRDTQQNSWTIIITVQTYWGRMIGKMRNQSNCIKPISSKPSWAISTRKRRENHAKRWVSSGHLNKINFWAKVVSKGALNSLKGKPQRRRNHRWVMTKVKQLTTSTKASNFSNTS